MVETTNLSLLIAYDGTDYFGWQATHTGSSIESSLREVLEQILQHPVILQAASRTDRGVHAHGQVVNFLTHKPIDLAKLHHSLNALLPPSIVVREILVRSPSFHPTLDAIGKEYLYHIDTNPLQLPLNRYHSWHVPCPLDWELAQQASLLLLGQHDFSAFCNRHEGRVYPHKIREIWWIKILPPHEGIVTFLIAGNHFLYKMARNLVGTLVDVARHRLPLSSLPLILQKQKRAAAGICAPAHGLSLHRVFYTLEEKNML